MRVTHVHHSGFVVELEEHALVFDWYAGDLPALDPAAQVVVLVSHAHGDHYGRCAWDLEGPRTRYVLDRGLAREAQGHGSVTLVEPHRSYDLGDLRVETLESNDEGVAFVVTCEGRRILFAGDLNVWWWDRPEPENRASEAFFRRELARVAGRVDVAFVPLDPRLADPVAGVVACEEELGPDALFPMHYGDEAARARELAADARLDPWRDSVHLGDVTEL